MNESDDNGNVILKAPCYRKTPYNLKIIYNGFLVNSKEIKFGIKTKYIPYSESFSLTLYNLNIKVKDLLGLIPAVNINPIISSNNMINPEMINIEENNNGDFSIFNLYPEEYIIKMSYKSFDIEEKIIIDQNKNIELLFPAEYYLDLNCMNSVSGFLNDGKIKLGGSSIICEESSISCCSRFGNSYNFGE